MYEPFRDPSHRPFALGEGRRAALLVHGFPGTPAELRPLAVRLAERGWRAHGPLLPGFGTEIATLGERRWTEWLAAVEGAFREVAADAEEVALIGYSMGGALALAAAETLRPATLVLLAPFCGTGDPRERLLPLARRVVRRYRPYREADFGDEAVRASVLRVLPDLDLDDDAVLARVRDEVSLPTAALDQVVRLGRAAWRAAPRVDARTLVVQGLHDDTVRAPRTRALALRLGGRLELLELDAGHRLIQDDAPLECVAERIGTFLAG